MALPRGQMQRRNFVVVLLPGQRPVLGEDEREALSVALLRGLWGSFGIPASRLNC